MSLLDINNSPESSINQCLDLAILCKETSVLLHDNVDKLLSYIINNN